MLSDSSEPEAARIASRTTAKPGTTVITRKVERPWWSMNWKAGFGERRNFRGKAFAEPGHGPEPSCPIASATRDGMMHRIMLFVSSVLSGLAAAGCQSSGFHGHYYDPNQGCVYQPGWHHAQAGPPKPSLLEKLSLKKNKCDKGCPLCAQQNAVWHGSESSGHWDGSGHHMHHPGPGGCAGPMGCSGPGGCGAPVMAGCGGPVGCSGPAGCSGPMGCGGPAGCGAPVFDGGMGMPSGCSGCGAPAPTPAGCTGCGMPAPETMAPGCTGCQQGHNAGTGPIFEGSIVPGETAPGVIGNGLQPVPAPPADAEPRTVAPQDRAPEPAGTTMSIPTFPNETRTRHVHWVPTPLK